MALGLDADTDTDILRQEMDILEDERCTYHDDGTVTDANGKHHPHFSKSPLCDESVCGFDDDEPTDDDGMGNMKSAAELLAAADVPCCFVGERALIQYWAGRVAVDWIMCVPTDQLSKADGIFRSHPKDYTPFRRSAMRGISLLDHKFPRFKCVGVAIFFVILSSKECHIPCTKENTELNFGGVPFPKLAVFAQSLIDTGNVCDLDDLVDGLNLPKEWGEEHLDLDGEIDMEWFEWRDGLLEQDGKYPMNRPVLRTPGLPINETKSRREIWEHVVSGKIRRQGHKFDPRMETRFFRKGAPIRY